MASPGILLIINIILFYLNGICEGEFTDDQVRVFFYQHFAPIEALGKILLLMISSLVSFEAIFHWIIHR